MGYFGWEGITNDYVTKKVIPCKVVGKMTGEDRYKHKTETNWILVLENQGRDFDLEVTPATYYHAKEGETLYFSLSDENIKHSEKWTLIEVLGFLGLFVSGGVFVSAIILLIPSHGKED